MIVKKYDVKITIKHIKNSDSYIHSEQTINHIKIVEPQFKLDGEAGISKNFQFDKFLTSTNVILLKISRVVKSDTMSFSTT